AVALDIGASPGGWSYWLADRCATVVAVDPGALKAPIPSNVIHVQDRIENFLLPEMQANADFGGGLK
ncbi:ribosomal RNA large subunit methyltransferase J, partial [Sphaeroforma arctica JP610]